MWAMPHAVGQLPGNRPSLNGYRPIHAYDITSGLSAAGTVI